MVTAETMAATPETEAETTQDPTVASSAAAA
jgi:hypothetical protein